MAFNGTFLWVVTPLALPVRKLSALPVVLCFLFSTYVTKSVFLFRFLSLAYVPDFPFLYDKLTPWEFLRFTGQLFHMNEEDIEKRTRDLIPRFSLEPYLRKSIESLSHGTRQRIAIVSALMHNPEVFVLDEPMVGLDPHHQYILKEVLKERAAQGMTVFLSTHQLSVAEEVADRIGIVHMGKLVAVGTEEELHNLGGEGNAELEATFLALTREESDVAVQRQLHQG